MPNSDDVSAVKLDVQDKKKASGHSVFKEGLPSPTLLFSLRVFEKIYNNNSLSNKLEDDLKRSKIPLTAVQYLSLMSLYSLFFLIADIAVSISVSQILKFNTIYIIAVAFLSFIAWGLYIFYFPSSVTSARRKDIDAKLPIAISYISAMASADIPIDRIFSDLGKIELYGEISREAKSISVLTEIFGMDILGAIKEASKFSPSRRFAEFLSGIYTTANSGGNLREYLLGKAKQYNSELTIGIRRNVESIGVLAESYITVGVAFPLMMMVIVGVIAVLSPSPSLNIILFLAIIVGIMIPVITGLFSIFIRSTMKEVEF
ncbi:MAG: type II secretion system F family protein [Thermoplasmataceae archaeon]